MTPSDKSVETPAAAGANPMRKIILMVAFAIMVFLAFTAYSVHKSIQSNAQLTDVKELYFPVLQGIEANIVRLDKMEEIFLRSVMTGDHDALDDATKNFGEASKTFQDIARLDPGRAAQVKVLQDDLARYHAMALSSAKNFLKTNEADPASQAKMTQLLAELRKAVRQFREASYSGFTRTLSDTQGAVKLNLYMGVALGAMNLFFMGVLVFFIRRNVSMMAVIAEQNATLERRVTERTAQLRQKTQDIQAMLQNMPQGVLTVLADGTVHPEYAAYLETILASSDIAGRPVMELLFTDTTLGSDALSQVDAAIGACIGEDQMNFGFNAHLLPTEYEKRDSSGDAKSLDLSWSPICDEAGTVEKLMVCVRDVTELKRLTQAANLQKRELEIIGEVLGVSQEKFQEFVRSAQQFVEDNEDILGQANDKDAKAIGLLFRNMHTIKGNARTYGLRHLTNVVHEAEQEYDRLRHDTEALWEPATLRDQLASVRNVIDEYQRINDDTLGRKGPGRRAGVERFLMVDKDRIARSLDLVRQVNTGDQTAMRDVIHDLERTLNSFGTERVEDVLSGIVEGMPSLARELGKEPPTVQIHDNGIAVRTQISGLLRNVFTHLFRNSMDHGLETAAERTGAGKPAAGRIELAASLTHQLLTIRLHDDGRGLNIGKIRQKAIQSGVIGAEVDVPPEDVAQFIFASGFSTAEQVTEVSGRGVGMDAVRGFLTREGGDVSIRFLDDANDAAQRPFELVITLPAKFGAALA